MIIAEDTTLVFIGDSITDCGRERPARLGMDPGNGYVACIQSLLAAGCPERKLQILNTGISGNRVPDLEARWKPDVLDLRPDWLSVMIGINDVWRQFDRPMIEDQVRIDRFEAIYRKLLENTRPRLKGLVIMSPYLIEPAKTDPMRARMDDYGSVTKKLASEFDAVFVDVQSAFDRYLEHRDASTLATDRIHPNLTGHMIIATAFLQAIGFSLTQ